MDGSETKYSTLSRVEDGDIIVNKIWARNGSVAVVSKGVAGAYVSSEFPTFAPTRQKLDPRWFHWFTKTLNCWEQCDEKSRGTSGKNRIRPEQFLEIAIPLPPLDEQRRIVARIEALAAKIEEARSLRQNSVEEAQAFVASETNALFTGEDIRRWPTKTLEEVAEVRSGVTLGRQLRGRTIRLPYLRVANVQDGHLDLTKIKEVEVLESEADKWKLQRGDLLLTEGGDWDKLGRGTVWLGEIPNCIHQNHIFCVRTRQDDFIPEFLAKFIGSPVGRAYFQGASKQTTNLASINQRQLKAFKIFQPPLREQRRIVAELEALQAKVGALKALQAETAAELDAFLPSILDKAFKGDL
jgi:type I restriction enzyme S subunit